MTIPNYQGNPTTTQQEESYCILEYGFISHYTAVLLGSSGSEHQATYFQPWVCHYMPQQGWQPVALLFTLY